MSRIHILDDFTINQISAGEVVERPASIVKELIENSIDAGSSAITIEIQNGGLSSIRVTDNGEGINEEDAKMAFYSHATSKITSAADLQSIRSLGFRGEALASIAAVTQMEMITRTSNASAGTHLICHGGEFVSIKRIGCPEGTTIIVRNLFYNTPARLKFLKSERAETAQISDLIGKLILAHPEISFKYLNQGKLIYHSPGNGDLLSSITCVYGGDVEYEVFKISQCNDAIGISLTGFLGKPSLSRMNRNHETFFINGRYIKNKLLSRSIEDAYRTRLTINHFPWAVLHLSVPLEWVDVNVHPAKTEVRFIKEEEIYHFMYNSINDALAHHPHIPKIGGKAFISLPEEKKMNTSSLKKLSGEEMFPTSNDSENTKTGVREINAGNYGMNREVNDHNNNVLDLPSLKVLGRVFSTYIVVEGEEQLYFIDQHAAHERILYDQLTEKLAQQQISIQQIMPPAIIEVTHDEQLLINSSMDLFNSLGFQLDYFGTRTFLIRGVPILLKPLNVQKFFRDLLDLSNDLSFSSSKDMLLKKEDIMRLACKQAVKAHDPLSDQEILALVSKIIDKKISLTCPHGRPIIIAITKYEIERKFKRIQ